MIYAILISAIVAFSAGFGTSWQLQENRYEVQIAKLKGDAARKESEAKDAQIKEVNRVRAEEQAVAQEYQDALNESRAREVAQRSSLASARAQSERLQHQLADAKTRLAQAPVATVIDYTLAANAVLDDCRRAYEDMAATATGHAADVRTLIEAWPVAPAH